MGHIRAVALKSWFAGFPTLRCPSKENAAQWKKFYLDRWGSETELTTDAAKLAGSWKRLYRSKHAVELADDPWQKPSPYEVQAAIAQLCTLRQEASELAVVFLIDGSGSMDPGDFTTMSSFVIDAAEAISSTHETAQIGVVQFSNDTRVELSPQKLEMERFKETVINMGRMNGGTNFAVAIQKAGQLLKPLTPSTARTLVLLTDGRVDPYQGQEAVEMAERLVDEQAGVSIFAFGVGRGVDRSELEKIINVCGPKAADTRYLALCTNDEAPW